MDSLAGGEPVTALAEALAAAQAELPTALKRDAEAPGYRYMTLDQLIAATRPILNAHGLALTQWPSLIERGETGALPTLTTLLFHVSGETHTDIMPLYLLDKTMQGLGAAITCPPVRLGKRFGDRSGRGHGRRAGLPGAGGHTVLIGTGQHIWVQMWGPEGEVVQDGVLFPGSDISLVFTDGPQLVARFALTRITKAEAERQGAEKGVQVEF